MKKSGQIFSFVFTIIFCLFAFGLMTFFSIQKAPLETSENAGSTPKKSEFYGENLLFELPFESVLLAIEKNSIGVYFMGENTDKNTLSQFGYTVTKTVKCDYDTFAEIVDTVGGVDLPAGDKKLLFTGVQISEILKSGAEKTQKQEITEKILIQAANEKTGTDLLRFILENTETDLSFPKGYDIILALPLAAQNINFINGEEQQ